MMTPEQAEIVGFGLEPLRVTAGAGTGKTTTMARRLADLIDRNEVEPERALGITFTNKAAAELADRLRTDLSDLAASGRQVEVTTYHGFAYSLLGEFGALVGLDRRAQIVSPGYVRELLREALGSGSYQALDLSVAGHRIEELSALASAMGDHLLTPDEVAALDDGTGVWPQRRELLAGYRRYGDIKRRLGVVDYADLISLAHRLVTEHPEAADRIRDRYQVVLLDEYQDTNPAQRELLRALFGLGFPITAVGDPDQTIYEWRGASLENFARFPEHFPTAAGGAAADLPLSCNWRSGIAIVEIANLVRARIARDRGLDRLVPRPDAPPGWVGHAWYRSAAEEADAIATEVRRLHDDEGTPWRDIAILFRKNAQISRVRDALVASDVPIEVAALGGLLDVPEVSDLHAWLRLLGRSDDAPALMRILLGSRFRLGLGDVAPLARWVRSRRPDTLGDQAEEQPGWVMLEAIDSLHEISDLGDEPRRRLVEFATLYRQLLEAAQGLTLVSLCRRILDGYGAWPEVEALPDAARLSARLNLYRFLDLAENWSPLAGRPSLEAFLDYLDALTDERTVEELDTARLSGDDAVALLTVHRAKGLEWGVVILPAVAQDTFPARSQRLEDPTRFADVVPYELRRDRDHIVPLPDDEKARREVLRSRHLDQEWRTAYVAATRARDRLWVTGAFWYTDGRAKQRSELFDIVAKSGLSEEVAMVAEAGDPPAWAPFEATADPDPVLAAGDDWSAALRRVQADPSWPRVRAQELGVAEAYDARMDQIRLDLENLPEPAPPRPEEAGFSTSVTGLVTYASCPKRFMWSEVDRLPRRPSAAAQRGVEFHRKVELHNRGSVPLDDDISDLYDMAPDDDRTPGVSAFESFKSSRFAASRPRFVEAPFDLRLPVGRIRGRIDAIYDHGDVWEIVDYKSGAQSDDPARAVQLQAYAVAATEVPFASDQPERLQVTFAYFHEGVTEESEPVDAVWIATARDHLTSLAERAGGGEFPPTPSPACHNCDFLRFCSEGRAWIESGRGGR